ncbi:MAG: hypothetical protein AUG44_20295 [Actinobacteria bacterium 13_1_20CM_3_71_11]|nr:MAG: hypothetical protein AUG44_20295 [Actinobacteria bacterium 13_1_20CM_3_71_11]
MTHATSSPGRPGPAPPGTDEALLEGVRAGEPAAIVAWIERDHPVAEFLLTVAAGDAGTADAGAPGELLARAWRAALAEVGGAPDPGRPRAILLREVLYAGDRWEGWWVDDDAVTPITAALRRAQVVAALRRLPLGLRVLLVLRDGAGLLPEDAAELVAGSEDQQDALIASARVGFIWLIDEQIGGGDRP